MKDLLTQIYRLLGTKPYHNYVYLDSALDVKQSDERPSHAMVYLHRKDYHNLAGRLTATKRKGKLINYLYQIAEHNIKADRLPYATLPRERVDPLSLCDLKSPADHSLSLIREGLPAVLTPEQLLDTVHALRKYRTTNALLVSARGRPEGELKTFEEWKGLGCRVKSGSKAFYTIRTKKVNGKEEYHFSTVFSSSQINSRLPQKETKTGKHRTIWVSPHTLPILSGKLFAEIRKETGGVLDLNGIDLDNTQDTIYGLLQRYTSKIAESLPLHTENACMRKQVISDCVVQEIGIDIGIEPWEHGKNHLNYYLESSNSYEIFEDISHIQTVMAKVQKTLENALSETQKQQKQSFREYCKRSMGSLRDSRYGEPSGLVEVPPPVSGYCISSRPEELYTVGNGAATPFSKDPVSYLLPDHILCIHQKVLSDIYDEIADSPFYWTDEVQRVVSEKKADYLERYGFQKPEPNTILSEFLVNSPRIDHLLKSKLPPLTAVNKVQKYLEQAKGKESLFEIISDDLHNLLPSQPDGFLGINEKIEAFRKKAGIEPDMEKGEAVEYAVYLPTLSGPVSIVSSYQYYNPQGLGFLEDLALKLEPVQDYFAPDNLNNLFGEDYKEYLERIHISLDYGKHPKEPNIGQMNPPESDLEKELC